MCVFCVCGCTVAREKKPHSLRARFGRGELPANCCHGSDELPTSVPREVAFFFPELPVQKLPVAPVITQTVMGKPEVKDNIRGVAPASLNQVLVTALADLCRHKPQGTEAMRYLAHSLMRHNPNKPQVSGSYLCRLTRHSDRIHVSVTLT